MDLVPGFWIRRLLTPAALLACAAALGVGSLGADAALAASGGPTGGGGLSGGTGSSATGTVTTPTTPASSASRANGSSGASSATLTSSAPATKAAFGFYIRGGGDGHGIGMSQYGALGFALHNFGYRQILTHYYSDTTLGQTSPNRSVTVLLKDGTASFKGATMVGATTLNPLTTYNVVLAGDGLRLVAGSRKIGPLTPPVTVTGTGPLTLAGVGSYRGSLQFRPDNSGGIQTVNALHLEDYVRGVISAEMPSSWPMASLEAQAVAARTYAITADAAGADFQVFSDTRSQVYKGVAAETPRTNQAVAATHGQVVDYSGAPATTYFFASSGGYTESIQNVWLGVTPEAWLVGVPDPYDGAGGNPFHRWHESLTLASAARTLRGVLKGTLRGIKVLQHGVSPRVVKAAVVGSAGSTTVSGPQLQQMFGLMSTYMSFTTITTKSVNSPPIKTSPVTAGSTPTSGSTTTTSGPTSTTVASSSPTGGATSTGGSTSTSAGGGVGVAARARVHLLQGSAFPSHAGMVVAAQRFLGSAGWVTVGTGRTTAAGAYSIDVPAAGTYRVRCDGIDGPSVRVS